MRYGRRRVRFRGAEVAAEDAAREARCQADFKGSFEENEDVFYLFQGATVSRMTGAKGISQHLSDGRQASDLNHAGEGYAELDRSPP